MQIDLFERNLKEEEIASLFIKKLKRIGRNAQYLQTFIYTDRNYPSIPLSLVLKGLQDVETSGTGILSSLNEVLPNRLKMPLNKMSSFWNTSLVLESGEDDNTNLIVSGMGDLIVQVTNTQIMWKSVKVSEKLLDKVDKDFDIMWDKLTKLYDAFQDRKRQDCIPVKS